MNNKPMGRLIGIGIGPGDSELITLKAIKTLNSLREIFVPKSADGKASLALEIAAAHLADGCRITELLFPMVKDSDALTAHWQEAAAPVAAVLRGGDDCGFLTLGDPMLFSTYIYLVRAVKKLAPQAAFETIPGISSAFAAAAKAGVPLAEGDESLAFITGDDIDSIESLMSDFSTIVIMKVGRRLPEIRAALSRLDLDKRSVLVHRVGLPGEFVVDVDAASDNGLGYLSTIIVRTLS